MRPTTTSLVRSVQLAQRGAACLEHVVKNPQQQQQQQVATRISRRVRGGAAAAPATTATTMTSTSSSRLFVLDDGCPTSNVFPTRGGEGRRTLSSVAYALADDHDDSEEDEEKVELGDYSFASETSSPLSPPGEKTKHCQTCSCDDGDDVEEQQQDEDDHNNHNEPGVLRLSLACGHSVDDDEVLPPPLPEPKYSVRRRVMPTCLTALNSKQGQQYLIDALTAGTASSYVSLTEHYVNQSDPAFCGVTTLLMVLNSFGVDPNVRWKGGWRYFGDEDTLLALCCLTKERVARIGITMEEFQRLGSCQGLQINMKRPTIITTTDNGQDNAPAIITTIDDFRNDIKNVLCSQSSSTSDTGDSSTTAATTTSDNGIIVVSFGRPGLGQTGDGHFSPVAAYHQETDSVLVLDVARFKYQPYWVKVEDLYNSMLLLDSATQRPRGWYVLHPPVRNNVSFTTSTTTTSSSSSSKLLNPEDQRPAHLVPQVGVDGKAASNCPLHSVKVTFCKIGGGNGKQQHEDEK